MSVYMYSVYIYIYMYIYGGLALRQKPPVADTVSAETARK